MLTRISKAYVAPFHETVAVFCKTDDGRKLRLAITDWDDERHPHDIARVISMRGRIYEDYWVEAARSRREA